MSERALRFSADASLPHAVSHRPIAGRQGDAQMAIAAGFSLDEVIWMLDLNEPRSDGAGALVEKARLPKRCDVDDPT